MTYELVAQLISLAEVVQAVEQLVHHARDSRCVVHFLCDMELVHDHAEPILLLLQALAGRHKLGSKPTITTILTLQPQWSRPHNQQGRQTHFGSGATYSPSDLKWAGPVK